MHFTRGLLAISAGAGVLIASALALAPTVIGVGETHAAAADGSHSWVSDAFPTGQASFARGG